MNQYLVPSIKDPRFLFVTLFSLFIYHFLTTPVFGRSPEQLIVVIVSCLAFDGLFKILRNEKIFPLSAVVSSIGIFALVDTKYLIIYPLIAFFSMASKYFLRVNGRHIFNPNNFGILLISSFFVDFVNPGAGARWGGDLYWSVAIVILGMILAMSVKRVLLVLSYLFFFLLMALARTYIQGVPFLFAATVLFTPGQLVFTYFMITDPKTSPASVKWQVFFGAGVAIFSQIFRIMEFRLSTLAALAVVAIFYSLFDYFYNLKAEDRSWRYLSGAF